MNSFKKLLGLFAVFFLVSACTLTVTTDVDIGSQKDEEETVVEGTEEPEEVDVRDEAPVGNDSDNDNDNDNDPDPDPDPDPTPPPTPEPEPDLPPVPAPEPEADEKTEPSAEGAVSSDDGAIGDSQGGDTK